MIIELVCQIKFLEPDISTKSHPRTENSLNPLCSDVNDICCDRSRVRPQYCTLDRTPMFPDDCRRENIKRAPKINIFLTLEHRCTAVSVLFTRVLLKKDLSGSRKCWKKYFFQHLRYLRVQDHFGHQKYSFCVEFAVLFEYIIRIEKSDMEKTPKKSQRYWHRFFWKFANFLSKVIKIMFYEFWELVLPD